MPRSAQLAYLESVEIVSEVDVAPLRFPVPRAPSPISSADLQDFGNTRWSFALFPRPDMLRFL